MSEVSNVTKLVLARSHDRLIAGDPGLVRLRAAGRALGTALFAAALIGGLVYLRGVSGSMILIGAALGLATTIVVTDAEPRDERITLLLFAPVACVTMTLGTLVAGRQTIAALVMLVGTFAAVFARRWGARGYALGSAGFLAYFLALFYRLPLRTIGWAWLAIALGVGSAALMRFVLLPEHPERVAKNTLRAFEARARLLLDLVERWLRAPGEASHLQSRVTKALESFEEIALELEERLDRSARPPEVTMHVMDVELSVEQIAEAGLRRKAERGREEKIALADAIAELSSAARGIAEYRGDDARILSVLEHVERMRELFEERPSLDHSPSIAPPEPSPSPSLYTRQALQATIGASFALVLGHAISSVRWPWAVMASFVVFNRATTAGDTLVRAWQRVVGTVLGVCAGASIAYVIAQHRNTEIALIFVCVFLAYYFMRVSYAWAMAWTTALAALLYHLLGRFSMGLLVVRVEETIVGAAFGAIAAAMVLPERASEKVRERAAEILRGAADRLRDIDAPTEHRVFERQMRKLREQVRPARRSPFVRARSTAEIARHVAALVYSLRHLSDTTCGREVRVVLAGEARTAERLAGALEGVQEVESTDHESAIGRARERARDSQDRLALHWAHRIDVALGALANEL